MSEAVFLEDICANPDDDTPRMIFADWLEDGRPIDGTPTVKAESPQGEADRDRAEFIRKQITAAQLPIGDERASLEQRAEELLQEHREEWTQSLRDIVDRPSGAVSFDRGFPIEIALTVEEFLEHAPALFAAAPLQVVWMRLDEEEWLQELERLAASPHLSCLTALDLSFNWIHNDGAETLAASHHLSRLTTLILHHNHISDRGVRALARSPYLARLETLDLSYNDIGDVGVAALAAILARREAQGLPHLEIIGVDIPPYLQTGPPAGWEL